MTIPEQTVALDVMGADGGPDSIIQGGLDAAFQKPDALHVVFVGDQKRIESYFKSVSALPSNISIQHADSEVPMTVSAKEGIRMRDSSIGVGMRLVKSKEASAYVSPGNTGAVMGTALLTLGRIQGVSRPAITALFPSSAMTPTVVLDVGANADCKPQHLSQFAVMGSVYCSLLFEKDTPRVGLLSIGEERSKGNELIFGAQNILADSKINFVGNIEGRDILSGTVDVAVTDGFTGNILLKFAESIQPLLVKALKRQIQTNIFSRMGTMLMLPFMKRMKGTFDYSEYGGAPLLGVNGVVVICHGSSNAKAIAKAIIVANEMVNKDIINKIHDELITNHFGQDDKLNGKSEDIRNGVVYAAESDD